MAIILLLIVHKARCPSKSQKLPKLGFSFVAMLGVYFFHGLLLVVHVQQESWPLGKYFQYETPETKSRHGSSVDIYSKVATSF